MRGEKKGKESNNNNNKDTKIKRCESMVVSLHFVSRAYIITYVRGRSLIYTVPFLL